MAGGVNEIASLSNVKIYRDTGGPERTILPVDLKAIQAGQTGPQIQANDVIVVERSDFLTFVYTLLGPVRGSVGVGGRSVGVGGVSALRRTAWRLGGSRPPQMYVGVGRRQTQAGQCYRAGGRHIGPWLISPQTAFGSKGMHRMPQVSGRRPLTATLASFEGKALNGGCGL